jgi:hypothetical protein
VAVRHHLDLGHTKPSAFNGLDEEPICVGQDRVRRHLYREEYLQAVDIGHDLGLRLDIRSVASAARLAPADATT